MTVIGVIFAIFKGLAAIPAILGYVKDFAGQVTLWFIQQQNNETLSKIADAAAFTARAQNDAERYKAAQMWQDAISRPRVSA